MDTTANQRRRHLLAALGVMAGRHRPRPGPLGLRAPMPSSAAQEAPKKQRRARRQ